MSRNTRRSAVARALGTPSTTLIAHDKTSYDHPYLSREDRVCTSEPILNTGREIMDKAIVQQAIAFVNSQYGLEGLNIAAQVDAIRAGGWLVTVWIGNNLKQRVIVAIDGTVRRIKAADGEPLGEMAS